MRKNFLVLISLSLLFFAFQAQASSIGLKPSSVELSSFLGQSVSQEILLFNTSKRPLIYTLQTDSEIRGLSIEPSEFKLEADQQQIVVITNKGFYPQRIDTTISIVARSPSAGSLEASAGVKMPLEVSVAFSPRQYLLAFFLCFAIIIVGKITLKRKEL